MQEHARAAIEAAAKGATLDRRILDAFLARSRTWAATPKTMTALRASALGAQGLEASRVLSRHPPASFLRHRRAARSHGALRNASPRGGEAVRDGSRLRARAEPPSDGARAGGAPVPHRPLPGQGAGPGHPVPTLYERPVRASLEPRAGRLDPSDHGGRLRRRGSRRVLRRASARSATSSRTTFCRCSRSCDGAAAAATTTRFRATRARCLPFDASDRPSAMRCGASTTATRRSTASSPAPTPRRSSRSGS